MRVSISQLRRIIREAAGDGHPAWIAKLPDDLKKAAENAVKKAAGDESKIKDIKERFQGLAAFLHDKGHGPRA